MKAKAVKIGVVGLKNSGKTSVIESIVQELKKRRYFVATVKHVNTKSFSMDIEGKDTWRHSAAGANPVVIVSNIETAILMKDGAQTFSLDQLHYFAPKADIIVLEGFSWLVLNDERVGKIVCVRNRDEYENFIEKTKGEVIAFCSTRFLGKPILRIKEDSKILVRRTLRYFRKKRKIL